jgi:hypothetical protein
MVFYQSSLSRLVFLVKKQSVFYKVKNKFLYPSYVEAFHISDWNVVHKIFTLYTPSRYFYSNRDLFSLKTGYFDLNSEVRKSEFV